MFSWKTILSIGLAEPLSHTDLQLYDDSLFTIVSTPSIMGLNNKKKCLPNQFFHPNKHERHFDTIFFLALPSRCCFHSNIFYQSDAITCLDFQNFYRSIVSSLVFRIISSHSSCVPYMFHIHRLEGGLLDPCALKYIFLGYLATQRILSPLSFL